MARQLRIEFEGAFYHVTSRGNLRERIFLKTKTGGDFWRYWGGLKKDMAIFSMHMR